MKTSELNGIVLDYWVARADGDDKPIMGRVKKPYRTAGTLILTGYARFTDLPAHLEPSVRSFSDNWLIGGPIMGREITRTQKVDGGFIAVIACGNVEVIGRGETLLIAVMRCYVAANFGDEVPDDAGYGAYTYPQEVCHSTVATKA